MSIPPAAPPDEEELTLRLAHAGEHLRADRLEEATAEIGAVLSKWPDDVRARNMLGLLHFRAGSFPEARLIYSELLAEHGEDASLRLNLGLVELRMGNYDEAVRHLGWVAEAEPDNARAHGYYGLALMRSGDTSQARDVLSRAGQDDLVRQIDRTGELTSTLATDGKEGGVEPEKPTAAPPLPEEFAAPATQPPVRREERVAITREPRLPERSLAPRPAERHEMEEARSAIAAGAKALDSEQPFATPEESPQTAEREWHVGLAADGLPAPSSRSPLRPIPVPRKRSVLAGATISAAQAAVPLGQLLRERELAPPDDGSPFGVNPDGLLVVRIDDRLPTRSVGVVVSTGALTFDPLQRRARGRVLSETFGEGPTGLFRATGRGMMVISPRGGHFVALALAEEAIYLRESTTFAFEEGLHWESGRIPGSGPAPGSGHPGLSDELSRVVQFRGTGQLVVRSERPLLSVRLPGGQTSFIEVEQLIGWTGRIIPSLLLDESGAPTPYVECSGEGYLLVEPPPREGNPAAPAIGEDASRESAGT